MSRDLFKKRKEEHGYLSIGKDYLDINNFVTIENTDGIKPRGGLWATNHEINSIYYNDWMDYLTEHPHLIFYKYQACDIPAIFFTLKHDAKILTLDSKEIIDNIRITYPNFNGNIDYSLLSTDYDGVYIDIKKLTRDDDNIEYIKEFCVDTLLLFNLNCIQEYKQSLITIDFLNDHYCETVEYIININKKTYSLDDAKLTRKRR